MIPGNEQGIKETKKREIFMKGAADLVLSPKTFHNRPIISKQQLNVIFKFLGTPETSYINSIRNKDLRKWIAQQKKQPPKDFAKLFPKVSEEARDFMHQMLIYEADQRWTCEQLLKHKWFSDIKDVNNLDRSHKPMIESFEDVYLNDYELRLMVVDEILEYNKEWREHLKLQYSSIKSHTTNKLEGLSG